MAEFTSKIATVGDNCSRKTSIIERYSFSNPHKECSGDVDVFQSGVNYDVTRFDIVELFKETEPSKGDVHIEEVNGTLMVFRREFEDLQFDSLLEHADQKYGTIYSHCSAQK